MRDNFFQRFQYVNKAQTVAVTEFVGSLPTKTSTLFGDASENVVICTCTTLPTVLIGLFQGFLGDTTSGDDDLNIKNQNKVSH